MTLRKDPMDQLSALYLVAQKYPGGVPALAVRLGVAASTLYAQLRGDEPLQVDRQDAILHFARQARVANWTQPLHAKAHEHGGIFVALADLPVESDALTQSMLLAVKEFGDLAGVAAADVADGLISQRELVEIEREGYEAVSAITAFVELCRVRARG